MESVGIDEKRCSRCGQIKSFNQFNKNCSTQTGLHSQCRKCQNIVRRAHYIPREPRPAVPDGMKRCGHCGQIKDLEAFHRNKSQSDGLANLCKFCAIECRKKRKLPRPLVPNGQKRCSRCHETKSILEFYNDQRYPNKVRSECKDCSSKREKNRYIRERPLSPEFIPDGYKWCSKCNTVKLILVFGQSRGNEDGFNSRCNSCRQGLDRQRLYGLTKESYERLLEAQNGKCANLNCTGNADVIDHDHNIGAKPEAIRGLLCGMCNSGIGFFYDNPELLRGAAAYIDRFTKNSKDS